jgi:hypothetical protein
MVERFKRRIIELPEQTRFDSAVNLEQAAMRIGPDGIRQPIAPAAWRRRPDRACRPGRLRRRRAGCR